MDLKSEEFLQFLCMNCTVKKSFQSLKNVKLLVYLLNRFNAFSPSFYIAVTTTEKVMKAMLVAGGLWQILPCHVLR